MKYALMLVCAMLLAYMFVAVSAAKHAGEIVQHHNKAIEQALKDAGV